MYPFTGKLIMLAIVLLFVGCGTSVERNPQFVGKWRSGLPVSTGIVPGNISRSETMNANIQSRIRQKNATGEHGVELTVRGDGTFTMRLWMSSQQFDSRDQSAEDTQSPREHTVDGTWQSVGNEIHLTSTTGFLPYSSTKKTRTPMYRGQYSSSGGRTRSAQFLPLVLRSNGRLSQFPDTNVRPGTHERGLDFRRVIESD